jgi:hypothetical protein
VLVYLEPCGSEVVGGQVENDRRAERSDIDADQGSSSFVEATTLADAALDCSTRCRAARRLDMGTRVHEAALVCSNGAIAEPSRPR